MVKQRSYSIECNLIILHYTLLYNYATLSVTMNFRGVILHLYDWYCSSQAIPQN